MLYHVYLMLSMLPRPTTFRAYKDGPRMESRPKTDGQASKNWREIRSRFSSASIAVPNWRNPQDGLPAAFRTSKPSQAPCSRLRRRSPTPISIPSRRRCGLSRRRERRRRRRKRRQRTGDHLIDLRPRWRRLHPTGPSRRPTFAPSWPSPVPPLPRGTPLRRPLPPLPFRRRVLCVHTDPSKFEKVGTSFSFLLNLPGSPGHHYFFSFGCFESLLLVQGSNSGIARWWLPERGKPGSDSSPGRAYPGPGSTSASWKDSRALWCLWKWWFTSQGRCSEAYCQTLYVAWFPGWCRRVYREAYGSCLHITSSAKEGDSWLSPRDHWRTLQWNSSDCSWPVVAGGFGGHSPCTWFFL